MSISTLRMVYLRTVVCEATYDEYNRMKSYRFTDSGAYDQIEYDSLGRVWKRIDMSSNEKMYYHTARSLAQEIEQNGEDLNVVTDYMARSRRYMPGEADAAKYRYYHRDHLGSVALMSGHEVATEEYTYDAWGEHVESPPSTNNKVRYAGAYLETFVGGATSNAIYLCGERHYWASYGRFLRRDALCYRKMPNPTVPLKCNPYIYADNNPVMKRDLNGLAANWVRGCYRGDKQLRLGTSTPTNSAFVDCETVQGVAPDDLMDQYVIRYNFAGGGRVGLTPGDVGGSSVCSLRPEDAQPKDGCANTVDITPELCCSYLDNCMEDDPKFRSQNGCPTGMVPYDIGFASDPLDMELTDKEFSEYTVFETWYHDWTWEMIEYYNVSYPPKSNYWRYGRMVRQGAYQLGWMDLYWFMLEKRRGLICFDWQALLMVEQEKYKNAFGTGGPFQDWVMLPWSSGGWEGNSGRSDHHWVRLVPKRFEEVATTGGFPYIYIDLDPHFQRFEGLVIKY